MNFEKFLRKPFSQTPPGDRFSRKKWLSLFLSKLRSEKIVLMMNHIIEYQLIMATGWLW